MIIELPHASLPLAVRAKILLGKKCPAWNNCHGRKLERAYVLFSSCRQYFSHNYAGN